MSDSKYGDLDNFDVENDDIFNGYEDFFTETNSISEQNNVNRSRQYRPKRKIRKRTRNRLAICSIAVLLVVAIVVGLVGCVNMSIKLANANANV